MSFPTIRNEKKKLLGWCLKFHIIGFWGVVDVAVYIELVICTVEVIQA